MATTIDNARTIVREAGRNATDTNVYSNSEVDRAIQSACNEFVRRTNCSDTSGTLTLTADTSEVDVSSLTTFNPDQVYRIEIAYVDQGTWAQDSTYAVNDVVKGDGSPDSYFYRCIEAHTDSSGDKEPPNTTYWTQVAWKGGWKAEHVDYSDVAYELNRDFDSIDADVSVIQKLHEGRPKMVGFKDDSTAYVYPVPRAAWTMRVFYRKPFIAWDAGGMTTDSLNIDDSYILPVLRCGAVAELHASEPENVGFVQQKRAIFEAHVRRIAGDVGRSGNVTFADQCEYI
jgi:hypothetical protein